MEYLSTVIPDSVSVDGIVTVLRHTFEVKQEATGGEKHDFPEILYIIKGELTVLLDGVEHELNEGQLIIYAPNVFHASRQKTNVKGAILSFKTESKALFELYNRTLTLTPEQRSVFLQIFNEGLDCFISRSAEEKAAGKRGMIPKETIGEYTLQKLKKRLEFFLAELLEHREKPTKTKSDREFLTVAKYLESHIGESLKVETVADDCLMSVSKLKLLFREKTGGGPIDYFIKLKIDRARMLIEEGRLNFTEIADRLGFCSLHYFSRTFKKHTGQSPSEYSKGVEKE